MVVNARRVDVHGKVQGVFYRDWTVETASALGLKGWVRNCVDGSVEAHLQGDDAAIERMIAAMQEGPPRASVTRVQQYLATEEDLTGFERRD